MFCIVCAVGQMMLSLLLNMASPMLIYSFTKNENVEHDLYTFLTKSENGFLVNMKIITFF
jgi:hypothetical protein